MPNLILTLVAGLTTAFPVIAAIATLIRRARVRSQMLRAIYAVVVGQPADLIRNTPDLPGVAKRLDDQDVRLKTLERNTGQLVPNGGSSLADKIAQIAQKLDAHINLGNQTRP